MSVKNETEDGFVVAADLTLRQKSSLGKAGCGKDKYDLVKENTNIYPLFLRASASTARQVTFAWRYHVRVRTMLRAPTMARVLKSTT